MNRFKRLLAASLVFLPTNAVSDTLTASRLIYRVTPGQTGYGATAVPAAGIVTHCADADGCKVSLKITDGYGLEAKSTRLYLNEGDPLQWLSEAAPVAGAHRDGDANTDQVLNLWLSLSNCGVSDWDLGSTADSAAGFAFGAVAGPGLSVTCTLVIED